MRLIKTGNSSSTLILRSDMEIYFSYETPIAIVFKGDLLISENEWGATTGKHLNAIDRDKSIRVPHRQLMNTLNMITGVM